MDLSAGGQPQAAEGKGVLIMAFSSNNYEQLGFGDRLLSLGERERRMLEESFAGDFAAHIFPAINERIFADLFSEASTSPSSPVNVTVGALILEEIFGYNDEQMVNAVVCDLRFQYALHTTSAVVQPVSSRSLSRFRKRLSDYRKKTGRDLLQECLGPMSTLLDSYVRRFQPSRVMDTQDIVRGIERIRSWKTFRPQIIQDPKQFEENALPPHSALTFYAGQEEMQRDTDPLHPHSSFFMSLNGLFRFSCADNPADAPEGFEKKSYDCSSWQEIDVPSHIQLEGYDRPQYCNYQYPWDGREDVSEGRAPVRFNPTGSYLRFFRIPSAWRNMRIRISFQGVESGFAVWLNGQYIGYSENSFSPTDFDLTDYIDYYGQNRLAVRVFKWTSGSWLEDQDFWRFSGIFRDVFLYAVPDVHLEDLTVRTLPDERMQDWDLDLQMHFSAREPEVEIEGQKAYGEVHYALMMGEKCILAGSAQIGEGGNDLSIKEHVTAPHLWSAEDPFLYELRIVIDNNGRREMEAVRTAVGFRQIAVKDGRLLLNGKRLVLRGVNRHEFTCDHGRAGMSPEQMQSDLFFMKRNNINAVRTSHYPDSALWYSLCDRYGIYVLDEVNMETHGTWAAGGEEKGADTILPGEHRQWLPALQSRVQGLCARDRNHPSVIVWSVGNESHGGSVVYEMSRLFRKLDPDRPVHYEGTSQDPTYAAASDVTSRMYWPAAKVEEFLKKERLLQDGEKSADAKEKTQNDSANEGGTANAEDADILQSADEELKFLQAEAGKPFILCEYAHSMGNSDGDLYAYTALTAKDEHFQGGFIWDFNDQAIRTRDECGREFFAYGGDFGDRPNDGTFSGNGILSADRRPRPAVQEIRYCYQNIRVRMDREHFTVDNRNLFTNTNAYLCTALLQKNGRTEAVKTVETDVEPGTSKTYPMPFADLLCASENTFENGQSAFQSEEETIYALQGRTEYTVIISFRLREDAPYAPAGYEIAFGQGIFRSLCGNTEAESTPQAAPVQGDSYVGAAGRSSDEREKTAAEPVEGIVPSYEMIRGTFNIGIRTADEDCSRSALFSLLQGSLVSCSLAGREMIKKAPSPDFWRAPTDNDLGWNMPMQCGIWAQASRYLRMEGTPRVTEKPDGVSMLTAYRIGKGAECFVTCTLCADGSAQYSMDYVPGPGEDLPPMPSFGMRFTMDSSYDRIRWYGMGPEECYADRDAGAKLGIWTSDVTSQLTDYLRPQECGTHTGTRWVSVTDRKGHGLLFIAQESEGGTADAAEKLAGDAGHLKAEKRSPSMLFSALPYTPEELENAEHRCDLPKSNATTVRISLAQMGVGGDDSWGAKPLQEYIIDSSKPMHFAFRVTAI